MCISFAPFLVLVSALSGHEIHIQCVSCPVLFLDHVGFDFTKPEVWCSGDVQMATHAPPCRVAVS